MLLELGVGEDLLGELQAVLVLLLLVTSLEDNKMRWMRTKKKHTD